MKMLTTAAALAAVIVSVGTALAAPPQNNTTMTHPNVRNQAWSNHNLLVARWHIESAMDGLQRDAEDYGGHRVKAIEDLRWARIDLRQALEFARAHEGAGVKVPGGGGGFVDENGGPERGQLASNNNLIAVRRHIERAIDALSHDASDYGGYKEKAIDRLQAARAELEAAIDFRQSHNGSMPGTRPAQSDANLRFVSNHIERAIDQLQNDKADYGGHKALAVRDLETARGDINQALAFDRNRGVNEGGAMSPAMPGDMGGAMHGAMTQGASNANIGAARAHIERAIDALTNDAHDYGGYRVKAIEALRAARAQLLEALNFRR